MADRDYVVVGAGAAGLAFVDSLVDHAADVRVTVVDRRDAPGGHWRDAYRCHACRGPFTDPTVFSRQECPRRVIGAAAIR